MDADVVQAGMQTNGRHMRTHTHIADMCRHDCLVELQLDAEPSVSQHRHTEPALYAHTEAFVNLFDFFSKLKSLILIFSCGLIPKIWV